MSSPIIERISLTLVNLTPAVPNRRSTYDVIASRLSLIGTVEFRDGTIGCGEAVPPPTLSLEPLAEALSGLTRTTGRGLDGRSNLLDTLCLFHPVSFVDALDWIDSLSDVPGACDVSVGFRIPIEMALIDATLKFFERSWDQVVGWLELPGFGSPGSLKTVQLIPTAGISETAYLKEGAIGWPLRVTANTSITLNEENYRVTDMGDAGGMFAAMRCIHSANRSGLSIALTTPTYHTSIYTAAALRLLKVSPHISQAFLELKPVAQDVVQRLPRRSWRGKPREFTGFGLGVEVAPGQLRAIAAVPPVEIKF